MTGKAGLPHICSLIPLIVVLAISPVLAQTEAWTSLGLADLDVRCIAVAPGNSSLLLAGGNNLYVSTDGGQSWSTKQISGLYAVCFGSTQNTAYAGSWGQGIWKSTDGGATWTQKSSGLTNNVVKSICVSPTDDGTAYAGAEDGLYRTTNGGDTWSKVISGANINALAVAPTDPGVIYAGVWYGGTVYRSTDAGDSWQQLTGPSTSNCWSVAVDPSDASIVYICYQGGGVWVSFDAASTWEQITPSFEGFTVALDRLRPGFAYGVGGWTAPQRTGCYGGDGWHVMSAGHNGAFARGIAVDPNDSARVYAVANGIRRWIADVQPPDAPSALQATPGAGSIDLSWTASPSGDCAGYRIYRRIGSEPYAIRPYATVSGVGTTTYSDTDVSAGSTYYYKVTATDDAQNASPFTNEASGGVAATYDLDVVFIERLPRDTYHYWLDYQDGVPIQRPGTENDKRWPEYGETVTFVANIKNKGTANPGPASYRWKINGVQVATGTISGIEPGQTGTASLDWQWNIPGGSDSDHSDQTVTIEVDYDSQVTEEFEQNNQLTDYIEGLSLYIYCEPALYQAMANRITLTGTRGFEDWMQEQIRAMNNNFARSVYPLAPNGCLERVRIDKIEVGAQPNDDGHADGRWHISGGAGYADTFAQTIDNGLIHELMHQLGAIDLYQIGVSRGENEVITPDGLPNGYGWAWGRPGLMGGGDIEPHTWSGPPSHISEHQVVALNTSIGYRRGYYGEFLYDLPDATNIEVRDSAGNSVPGASVRVFESSYGTLPGTPTITGTTGPDGVFQLTNRTPVRTVTTATGHTLKANPFGTVDVVGGRCTLLLEVSRPGGDFDYDWMEITEPNLACWGGSTSSYTHVINSRLASNALPRITGLRSAVTGTNVSLEWPAVPGASSYRIYRAGIYLNQPDDPDHEYENYTFKPIGMVTGTTFSDTSFFETSIYAVCSADSTGKESALSNRVFAPLLRNPWDVVIHPDNTRSVLDPQNGHALIRQDSQGNYVCNFGSVHFHLEYSHFMALDGDLGRLIFSHPGDEYDSRQSVRVTDLDADMVFEIGETGSGPGQFSQPRGVAVDAEHRIYVVDGGNNRIQVFNSAGQFITAYGSHGGGDGQFDDAQDIAVDAEHGIYVCDKGNRRVQVLSFDGANLSHLRNLPWSFNAPVGITIADDGRIFVSDYGNGSVEAFSSDGNWLKTYTQPTGGYFGSLVEPTGLAVDRTGVLIVCDTGNRRVVPIDILQPTTPGGARRLPDGAQTHVQGGIVTAAFDGYFYVQNVGAAPGIRVVSAEPVTIGQVVDVIGHVATVDGEREIQANVVAGHEIAQTQPSPYGMRLSSLGGADSGPVPGVYGGHGANNIGLLVKVWGVTSGRNETAQEFYINDGSGVVRVHAPDLTLPGDGSYVSATGISGAEVISGLGVRVLRARAVDPF